MGESSRYALGLGSITAKGGAWQAVVRNEEACARSERDLMGRSDYIRARWENCFRCSPPLIGVQKIYALFIGTEGVLHNSQNVKCKQQLTE
jgi:hypothetical protein